MKQLQIIESPSREELLPFLLAHPQYTLFLLDNLEQHGPKVTNHPNSGNFYLLRQFNQDVALFSLTNRGILLLHSTLAPNTLLPYLTKSLAQESTPLRGMIGAWELCSSLWDHLVQSHSKTSKEVLYEIPLISPSSPHTQVRLLQPDDFPLWLPMHQAFLGELGFPDQLTSDQRRVEFFQLTTKKQIWGRFEEGALLSIARLNAKAHSFGQIGGVYTAPTHRRQGHSLAVLETLLYDAKALHKLSKLIVYTAEKNTSANRLYKSLGALPCGHLALLFTHEN